MGTTKTGKKPVIAKKTTKKPPIEAEVVKVTPKKKKPITTKEAKLIKGVIAGKTKRQAAKDAGYGGKDSVVSVTASQVLKKPNVQEAMELALAEHDLTPDRLAGIVADAMGATKVMIIGNGEEAMADVQPDHAIRLRAADMAGKFLGLGKDDSKPNGPVTFVFGQTNTVNRYIRKPS